MKQENNIISSISNHLFWDVDLSAVDQNKHANYIIRRVLQYGLLADWQKIVAFYGIEKIANTAIKIKDLDKKTASFLALISDTPKENFLCYTTEQSIPKHWNF